MSDVIPNGGGTPAPVVDLGDGSPEGHAAKMLAMSEPVADPAAPVADPAAPAVTPRPADVPEKFWDAEKGEINTAALLKSQADAEAALRGTVEPVVEKTPEELAAEAAAAAAPAAQPEVVANASAEYAEKGELSADTYAALDKAGLPKEMVNEYIAGQTAIVGQLQTAAYEPFDGGQEGYEAAANWAAEKMSEDEIKALDVQLMSNNPAIVAQGAKALQARYAAEADVEPSTIRGNSNNPATGGTYASSREMMKDMNSNKYRTSEAFRLEVAQKLARSNL